MRDCAQRRRACSGRATLRGVQVEGHSQPAVFRSSMTSRPSDPGRPTEPPRRPSGSHEREGVNVPATRAIVWIVVALVVVVGVVLYFLYQRRLSPVLG
jgi:hypothetical protein